MITAFNKQADIAGIDPKGTSDNIVRLFNPRKDNWSEHFKWDGPKLEGTTAIGRTTIYVLGINLAHRVALRKLLMLEGVFDPK